MLLGIDHLVIACADLGAAAVELEERLGLRAGAGGRHERLGTENRIVWLGDTYLELIVVVDGSLAAESWIGAPTLHALKAGGGLATYALASDDLAADLERLRAQGARLEGPLDGERRRPDGRLVRWRLGIPPRLGPEEPPFLLEHDPTSAEWTPQDREARAGERHPVGGLVRLTALELPLDDVARVQGRYLRALGLLFRPSLAGRGARDASVGSQTIRLRQRRGAEPPLIRLRVSSDPEPGSPLGAGPWTLAFEAELLGIRFALERGG